MNDSLGDTRYIRCLNMIAMVTEGHSMNGEDGRKLGMIDDYISVCFSGKLNHPINSPFTPEEQKRLDEIMDELSKLMDGKNFPR